MTRWDTRLANEGTPGFLTDMAKKLERDYDSNAVPFPPLIEKTFIDQIISKVKVSYASLGTMYSNKALILQDF